MWWMMLATMSLGAPVDIYETKVTDDRGTELRFVRRGDKPIAVRIGGHLCDLAPSKLTGRFLKATGELINEMSSGMGRHADWGWAMTGPAAHLASGSVSYCNAHGTTKDGFLMVTVFRNYACFGSAGCNTDSETLIWQSPVRARRAADVLLAASTQDWALLEQRAGFADAAAESQDASAGASAMAVQTTKLIYMEKGWTEDDAAFAADAAAVQDRLNAGDAPSIVVEAARKAGTAGSLADAFQPQPPPTSGPPPMAPVPTGGISVE